MTYNVRFEVKNVVTCKGHESGTKAENFPLACALCARRDWRGGKEQFLLIVYLYTHMESS